MRRIAGIVVVWMLSGWPGAHASSVLRNECLRVLETVARSEEFWVKVHAIEYLADLGYQERARILIRQELATYDKTPQKRIGYWRCSYKVAGKAKKEQWLKRIRDAYLDLNGPDRIHAVETLAKLNFSLKAVDRSWVQADLERGGILAAYTLWGHALAPGPSSAGESGKLIGRLVADSASDRKIAAYGLSYFAEIPFREWEQLSEFALREKPDSEAYPYLLGATYGLAPGRSDSVQLAGIRSRLLAFTNQESKTGRIELCRALAKKGIKADLTILKDLLRLTAPLQVAPPGELSTVVNAWNQDVQAAAAYAILSIMQR